METFLSNNSLYIVLGIALIIWAGIAFYLTRLDASISKIEKRLAESSHNRQGERN
ncbi:MAG: CcmD family protein [Chloroflexota bacterium]